MKRKQSGYSIGKSHDQNFHARGATERELSELEFEQGIQGLPESARVLLRFARERGLLPSEVNGETKRVPAPRDR